MREFVNIYAGALVALSSLRTQAGNSDRIPPQGGSGLPPSEAADEADPAGRPADAARILR
jgi:hypothetical protein